MSETATREYLNGTATDLGADLGIEPATRFMAIYGGKVIKVPTRFDSNHVYCRVLGDEACRVFVREYGGMTLRVPQMIDAELMRRVHATAELIRDGARIATIALVLSVTERTVLNYRAEAERLGLLPMILREKPSHED